jgi:hypothetical protein
LHAIFQELTQFFSALHKQQIIVQGKDKSRRPGHWCRTTLHYRGWSYDEINALLGEPDIQEDRNGITASYYGIPRTLEAENCLAIGDRANADEPLANSRSIRLSTHYL